MSQKNTDHDEVLLEQKEIFKERREHDSIFWLTVLFGSLLHGVILVILFSLVDWFWSSENSNVVATILSAAYITGVVSTYTSKVEARIRRMELHALTVHEAVLCIQDKVNETS